MNALNIYRYFSLFFMPLSLLCSGCSEYDNPTQEYMQKVLLIINNSSLDEELKQDLRNAFIIGNASYQLWNTEEK